MTTIEIIANQRKIAVCLQ